MKPKYVSFIVATGMGLEAVTSGRELSARDNPHLLHNEYPQEILAQDANQAVFQFTHSISSFPVVTLSSPHGTRITARTMKETGF
jgi:hypothetical protein